MPPECATPAGDIQYRTMHIQLDPVGGIAGDMFAAAVLDAWPEFEPPLVAALAQAGLDAIATVERVDHDDGALTGSQFAVHETRPEDRERYEHETGPTGRKPHGHGSDDHDHGVGPEVGPEVDPGVAHEAVHAHHLYRDIRTLLGESDLDAGVRTRALDIFARLAAAESAVHGVPVDDVSFHEVGAWDSIADVVSAAWLIERLDASWSCGPLPIGRGRINTSHGRLPVPVPATVELLRGMVVDQDQHRGERITPTGAAIVAHLAPSFEPLRDAMRLDRAGTGFGTSRLPGTSNVLRLLAFEPLGALDASVRRERIAVCEFEIDDQTGEDLAVALDRLRGLDGVLDVTSHAVHGKKGRFAVHVQLLSRLVAVPTAIHACFRETTTLGVRWHEVSRAALARASATVTVEGRPVRVKSVQRPGGVSTAKAEIDDLASVAGGHAERERVRASGERAGGGGNA